MKKLILIIAIAATGCEKNTCQTCTETTTVKFRDTVANTTRYEIDEHKYSLCDQAAIDEVDGQSTTGPAIFTAPLQHYKITIETSCD
jgi:hypothetical protein